MAILKIARMGHPLLKRTAEKIDDPAAPEICELIKNMIDTLEDTGGVGLAAPQVHISKRIVIFHIPKSRGIPTAEVIEPKGDLEKDNLEFISKLSAESIPLTVLINPIIEALDEETELGVEGCLSIPGMIGMVPRYKRIRYDAIGVDGNRIQCEASGFHARVVQHECDHLDGILYPMRMKDLSTFGYTEEIGDNRPMFSDEVGVASND